MAVVKSSAAQPAAGTHDLAEVPPICRPVDKHTTSQFAAMLKTLLEQVRPAFDRDKATVEELQQLANGRFNRPYVARQIGCSPPYLGQLVDGKRCPSSDVVHKLERFFQVGHGTLCPGGDPDSVVAVQHDLGQLRALRERRGLDEALGLTRIRTERGFELVGEVIQLVDAVEATEGAVDGRGLEMVEATLAAVLDLVRRGVALTDGVREQLALFQALTANPALVRTLGEFDLADLTGPGAALNRLAETGHPLPAEPPQPATPRSG